MSDDTYTHGHHDSVLRSHRWRTAENSCGYLLPRLTPGMRVLDVGCGPGTITRDLAALVAPGQAIGIDRAGDIVAQARAEGAEGVHFQQADVYRLPFGDDTFDVVHAHQLLQHLTRPVDALREMRRVAGAHGLVAARDSIYGSFRWSPDSPALEDWLDLYVAVTRRNDAEADAGRYLKAWAREAGFANVEYTSSTWTFANPETCRWWGDLWADRATSSDFASQAVDYGLADAARLGRIADGWRAWADDPDAALIILHGEVIASG
ncbi:MAG: methyltransferase domain-containing protein [Thermoleophilia bacterium]|nr:methyltransferase domain-containing protein [Thermoleophilia bacterium]